MEAFKTLQIAKPVLRLKLLHNGLLCAVDADTTLYFITPSTQEIAGGVKADVPHTRLGSGTVDIGIKGQVCATVIPEKKSAGLFAIKKKRFLFSIERHQGAVETIALDPQLRYMATGGQDGKLFVWETKSGRLADRLKPHTDFVSALAFHPHEPVIASGSYDRMIHLDTIKSEKRTLDLRAHGSAVIALAFYGDTGLISAGKNGEIYLWNTLYGTLVKRLPPMHDEIVSITLSSDERVLFVGTALGFVGIYAMDEQVMLDHQYLKVKGTIHSMVCQDDLLMVGTSNGEIHFVALFGDTEELDRYLEDGQFQQFYTRLGQNPLLAYSHWYTIAEEAWEARLEKATSMLGRGELLQAQSLLEPFANVKGKGVVVKQLLEEQEGYQQFKMHVDEGRYSLAYAMLLQYPHFRETSPYHQMEHLWKQLFAKAQALLESKRGEDEAKEALAPFRGISEKTRLIQELFQESKRYHFFKDLIGKREWKQVFELVRNYPFLKEFKEFSALLDQADKIYIGAQKAYGDGEYAKARQLAEMLLDFPDYQEDVQEILDAINI